MSSRNEDLVPEEASTSSPQHQQSNTNNKNVKPRKRDALFLGGTESAFSFGFGGDFSFEGGDTATTTTNQQVTSNQQDDDDDDEDEIDDEIEKELALEQQQKQKSILQQEQLSASIVRVTLDQVIEARQRFTGVARGFFGMNQNQQQQQVNTTNKNENVSSSSDAAVAAVTFAPVRKRRTIYRDAHCRNVKNLFEKIRQETAEKVYERDAARKRKLEQQQHKKGGIVEASFYEDDDDDAY